MSGEFRDRGLVATRRAWVAALVAGGAGLLAACSSNSSYFSSFSTTPAPNAQPAATLGTGQVKAALILPLSAAGNAGIAGQAMRNAADMALAEFNAPNVQLLVKDDAGSPDGARQAAQQALAEGAEIIIGPLFAQSVTLVGQVARARNVPVIAFSTDANVASPGVYLLSFLPETDVARIVQYSYSVGKRSYAALIPDNPYGSVVEAAFRQEVGRRGARIVAISRYPHDKAAMAGPIKSVADAAAHADALFLPDGSDAVPDVAQQLVADGVNVKRLQLLGTGLWGDDPRINATAALDGGCMRRPTRRAIAISPTATPHATSNSRFARQRWLTMPWRSLRLWSRRKDRSASRQKSSPTPRAFPESTACSASAPMAQTSADWRS